MFSAKKLCAILLSAAMLVSASACTAKQTSTSEQQGTGEKQNLSITISHQPYSHGLPSYIADKEGLFAKNGLDAKILFFTSGPAQNEALGANEWDVGAMGSPPSIAGGVAYNLKVIAFAVDDTASCDFWVRPDSPIAKISGQVPGSPDILGNAETWKGKTILCPTATSAHFMLIATLNKLGLTEKDVKIISMDIPQAYTAFKAGQGDIVALWDPQSFSAPNEGWVKVSSGPATGETMPTVIVASEKAIKEKPEAILAWLRTYFQVCDKYRNDIDGQAKYLLDMQNENGITTDAATAKKFVAKRPLPSIADEAKLFEGEYGSRQVDKIMGRVIDFFVGQGRYKESDKQKLIDNHFIDDQFIKQLIAEQK